MPCVEPGIGGTRLAPRRPRRPRRGGRPAPAGFSLIEMLVAMAVFGLAVLALLHLAGESTRSAALVEERVLAGVVADNRAVEAVLADAGRLQSAPDEGVELAGERRWHWRRRVAATGMEGIVRVDVTVRSADDGHVAAEASVFRSVQ